MEVRAWVACIKSSFLNRRPPGGDAAFLQASPDLKRSRSVQRSGSGRDLPDRGRNPAMEPASGQRRAGRQRRAAGTRGAGASLSGRGREGRTRPPPHPEERRPVAGVDGGAGPRVGQPLGTPCLRVGMRPGPAAGGAGGTLGPLPGTADRAAPFPDPKRLPGCERPGPLEKAADRPGETQGRGAGERGHRSSRPPNQPPGEEKPWLRQPQPPEWRPGERA